MKGSEHVETKQATKKQTSPWFWVKQDCGKTKLPSYSQTCINYDITKFGDNPSTPGKNDACEVG